jgi:hypothetical protein
MEHLPALVGGAPQIQKIHFPQYRKTLFSLETLTAGGSVQKRGNRPYCHTRTSS